MYHSKGEARNRKLLVRKQQFLGGNPLICSFDLAKKTHAFRVSDRARQPVASGTLSHTREGVERLLEKLEGLRTAQGYDRIVFFMEGASHFWMPLASLFERRGYPYRLVLNQATRHQRHLDGRARNYSDPIDAGHIGDLGRELHFTFSQLPKDPEWIGLRARAAEFQDLQDLATAEKNRIHAFLETAFMGYYAIFIDPFRPSSRAVLRALSHAQTGDEAAFIEATRQAFTGRKLQVARVRKVWQYLHSDDPWGYLEARPALAERLATATRRLDEILAQNAEVKQRLLAGYRQNPYSVNIDSIPHSCPTRNAILLGLLGDPKAFDQARALVHLAGLDPGMRSSGQFRGETHLTKAGRSRLRRAAVSATLAVMRNGRNQDFIARFFQLQHRTERPLTALQALCACAAKYLRIVWWLCVHHTTYSTDTAVHGFGDKRRTELEQLVDEVVLNLTTP